MQKKIIIPSIIVGLSLVLVGCGSASTTPEASKSPTASSSANNETELDLDEIDSTLETDSAPAAWAEDIFEDAPEGDWMFNNSEEQVIAVKSGYDKTALEAYAKIIESKGWVNTGMGPQLSTDSSYAEVFESSDGTIEFSFIGMDSGAPDESGEITQPITSIIVNKIAR